MTYRLRLLGWATGVVLGLSLVCVGCGDWDRGTKKKRPMSKWVKKADDLRRAACACKDGECAREQKKAVNQYIKATKGVSLGKEDKQRSEILVLKANTCLQKTRIKALLDKLKKSRKK